MEYPAWALHSAGDLVPMEARQFNLWILLAMAREGDHDASFVLLLAFFLWKQRSPY